MSWYRKVLQKNIKEIFSSAGTYLLTATLLTAWYFYTGKGFQWEWIEPLDAPSFFERFFYSALTYVTIGALLYKIRFYQFLYYVLGDWRSFKEAKALIWVLLLWLMYFKIVPFFFDVMNDVISIGYNLFMFVLYVAPWFFISVIAVFGYYYFRKHHATI